MTQVVTAMKMNDFKCSSRRTETAMSLDTRVTWRSGLLRTEYSIRWTKAAKNDRRDVIELNGLEIIKPVVQDFKKVKCQYLSFESFEKYLLQHLQMLSAKANVRFILHISLQNYWTFKNIKQRGYLQCYWVKVNVKAIQLNFFKALPIQNMVLKKLRC